ncbi:MAG: permease-like cell division protein FtsX [Panacagrimonas sp.]
MKPLDAMGRYFAEHARVCVGALGRQWRDPFGTLLTALVIGVTLALPTGLNLLVENLRVAAGGLNQTRSMTLFLRDEIDPDEGARLAASLARETGVAEARYLSREQALADFRERTELGAVLDALPGNPLPASITVMPTAQLDDSALQALADRLREQAAVEQLRLDREWIERLSAALRLAQRLASVLAIGLGLAAVLALGNTIRLEIEGRRDEIRVLQLIGASGGFIRCPFLYSGFWYGLSGGAIAVIAVHLARWALAGPVNALVALYDGAFDIGSLATQTALSVVIAGAALGIAGAWVAVWKESATLSKL